MTEIPEWGIPEMNRKLVERATHPDVLEAIVQELGDDWRIHANELTGGEIAEGLTAAYAIIQRDKDFFVDNGDVQFGTIEERIRTRLGDDSVEIEFKPPLPSPFDPTRTIDRLPVSVRWLAGADVERCRRRPRLWKKAVSPLPSAPGPSATIASACSGKTKSPGVRTR